MRKLLHRFVPPTLRNPFGLTLRLARSDNFAARYSMSLAAAGLAVTPLDWLLLPWEKGLYRAASPPSKPIVFIVGPPRSGTTLTYQLVASHFDLGYLNNLSALFPRAPLAAMRLLGSVLPQHRVDYSSFYGRSTGLSAPNDGLYVWDRWFDRLQPCAWSDLRPLERESLERFWGALQRSTRKPTVNKNNSLIAYAHHVAKILPSAFFICLTREPFFLAQSLLKARIEIQGDPSHPYGLHDPDNRTADHLQDVCSQVLFHRELTSRQVSRIGRERFWVVSYEDICRDPARFLRRLSEMVNVGDMIRQPVNLPISISNRVTIDSQSADRLRSFLEPLD